jgi:uncharacterized membrane protein SpoIIM required for sporulation
MVIDLEKFVSAERPYWVELEALLGKLEADAGLRLDLKQLQRLHYLYERTSADLGKLVTFASEPETRRYLETLVARAYGEIHETREKPHRLAPLDWFFQTFPQTFRRHAGAFWLAVAITMVGVLFGLGAVALDAEAKGILLPFGHGEMDPAKRVAREERDGGKHLEGQKGTFSTHLMTHNTKVSITAMALGMTWGIGTIVLLFYNGIILGGVVVDYVLAGQTKFLIAWLLPHGSIEIPAILIAGQAGLLLGRALIGRGSRQGLRARMRSAAPDIVTLIGGVAVMLVWAGFIEAFLSQYHGPQLYAGKIAFGTVELALLAVFLLRAGRKRSESAPGAEPKTR